MKLLRRERDQRLKLCHHEVLFGGHFDSDILIDRTTLSSFLATNAVHPTLYAHKVGLEVGLYLDTILRGAVSSKSQDLYGHRILKRDFGPRFYVNHFVKDLGICLKKCQNMRIALPSLALAQ